MRFHLITQQLLKKYLICVGSEDRQVGQVPVKDAFAWALNNLTLNAGDFSRRDRRVWKRKPGPRRVYGYRRHYRPRYRYDYSMESDESDSYESWEGW